MLFTDRYCQMCGKQIGTEGTSPCVVSKCTDAVLFDFCYLTIVQIFLEHTEKEPLKELEKIDKILDNQFILTDLLSKLSHERNLEKTSEYHGLWEKLIIPKKHVNS